METTIMETHMEKKMDNEMETDMVWGLVVVDIMLSGCV